MHPWVGDQRRGESVSSQRQTAEQVEIDLVVAHPEHHENHEEAPYRGSAVLEWDRSASPGTPASPGEAAASLPGGVSVPGWWMQAGSSARGSPLVA